MYVLDTNILIYFFKGIGIVADALLNKPPRSIGIPTIVLYELEVGIANSVSPDKRTAQLDTIKSVVNILPFGIEEATCAANIRSELEKKGIPIGPHDILIAATALTAKGILITHNQKEFSRVEGLQLEDWF